VRGGLIRALDVFAIESTEHFELRNMAPLNEEVLAIPLKVWKDPQGDVVLHHSRSECSVYFGCWVTSGEPADYLCQLTFHHAWAIRGFRWEYMPYKIALDSHSCIYEIEHSRWLNEASVEYLKLYPEWRGQDNKSFHHYIVKGHDNYIEIIAAGFDETIVPYDEAGGLRRLIDEA
jgi:hypothetical protein